RSSSSPASAPSVSAAFADTGVASTGAGGASPALTMDGVACGGATVTKEEAVPAAARPNSGAAVARPARTSLRMNTLVVFTRGLSPARRAWKHGPTVWHRKD